MLQIIDIHAHVWLGQETKNLQDLHRAAQLYGIKKILISPLGSHQPDPAEIQSLNQSAVDNCRGDDLFAAYVTVAPAHENAVEVLEAGLCSGAVGMKLWVGCLCNEKSCDPLYARCANAGIPVLVHTYAKAAGQLRGESTAVHLAAAAKRHPSTNFIMAHLGGNCYHGLPLIRDLPNVYADFSGSNCRADDLPYALEMLGAERILFGTDMPGSFAMSYGQLLAAELCEADQVRIARENAIKLFPALRN